MAVSQYSIVIHSQQLQALGINWPYKQYIRLITSKEIEPTVENIQEIFGSCLRRYQALEIMSRELEKYENHEYAYMQPLSRGCHIVLLFWNSYKRVKEKYGIICFQALEKKPPLSFDKEGFNFSPNLPC